MFTKPLDAIRKADIEALVAAGSRESQSIEYKRDLPGQSDTEKREFLADLCSFANHSGGIVLYGVDAQRGADGRPTGAPGRAIGVATSSPDAEILRLSAIAAAGLDPRIPGVEMAAVDGFEAGPILVVRVPQSLGAPHMVHHNDVQRFFGRNSAGKYMLDAAEIRAAVLRSEGQFERVEAFRNRRIDRALNQSLSLQLGRRRALLIHVVPVLHRPDENVLSAAQMAGTPLQPFYTGSSRPGRFNLDGFLIPEAGGTDAYPCGYVLLYRGGWIEAVDVALLSREDRVIANRTFEEKVLDFGCQANDFLRASGVRPPFLFLLTLIDAAGMRIGVRRDSPEWQQPDIDRSVVALPPGFLDDETVGRVAVHAALRPVLDAAWQAAGWAGSPNFDSNGAWRPPA